MTSLNHFLVWRHVRMTSLVSLVRVSENISGFRVDPIRTSGTAISDGGKFTVVTVLAVNVLKEKKWYPEKQFYRKNNVRIFFTQDSESGCFDSSEEIIAYSLLFGEKTNQQIYGKFRL